MKVENVGRLETKLKALQKKYGPKPKESVTVGFTQKYALYVHEVQAHHTVGQWKYLEAPARRFRNVIVTLVRSALAKGTSLVQSLMLGGLRLQREAQQLTPVDTSALKASAFTCPTEQVETVSQASYEKSEQIRLSELAARKKS